MKFLVLLSLLAVVFAAPQISPLKTINFDHYWTLDEIYDYMDELDAQYPDIVEVEVMGRTFEGREIRGLRITNESLLTEETPVILVTAGIIPREWISTMSAVDVMHELVEHYHKYAELVDKIDWFVIPVANPDGFVFSFTEGNRGWTKNRVPHEGLECFGVNIDRNFDFNWGIPGMRNCQNPCGMNYGGIEADSEEETKTIQFAIDITKRIQHAYINIRAAHYCNRFAVSAVVAHPFAFSNEAFVDNFAEQQAVGNIMAEAIFRSTGQRYRVNSESNVIGFIAGTSTDYAAGRDQIPLVYGIYAPRGGDNGFEVPEDRINNIVDEVFEAVHALGDYVTRN